MKALNAICHLPESDSAASQLFTRADYQCVRNAMGGLADDEYKAVVLRFWGNCSIEEVAVSLKITWNEADLLLTHCFEVLKLNCLSQAQFSRKSSFRLVSNSLGGCIE